MATQITGPMTEPTTAILTNEHCIKPTPNESKIIPRVNAFLNPHKRNSVYTKWLLTQRHTMVNVQRIKDCEMLGSAHDLCVTSLLPGSEQPIAEEGSEKL